MIDRPKNWRDIEGTISFLLIFGTFGLIGVGFQNTLQWTAAFLMGLAAMACGALVGFLFGLPRGQLHLNAGEANTDGSSSGSVGNDSANPQRAGGKFTVNTNLEEIADWLTKILLGAGLTQLGQLPNALESMANTVTPLPQGHSTVIAIWIFFATFGFFLSYLMTRLFVAGALVAADTFTDANTSIPSHDVKALNKIIGDLKKRLADAELSGKVELPQTPDARDPIKAPIL